MKNGIESKLKDSIGRVVPELTREVEVAVTLYRRIKVKALLECSECIVKDTNNPNAAIVRKETPKQKTIKDMFGNIREKLVKL